MDIPTETKRIEAHIRAAGFPVAELLRRAEVDVAQWQRWKKGQQDPRVGTWAKIERAFEEISKERAA
jgi:predicted transcriptional regulator